jgi:hypothetical protein
MRMTTYELFLCWIVAVLETPGPDKHQQSERVGKAIVCNRFASWLLG